MNLTLTEIEAEIHHKIKIGLQLEVRSMTLGARKYHGFCCESIGSRSDETMNVGSRCEGSRSQRRGATELQKKMKRRVLFRRDTRQSEDERLNDVAA